jgi:hypothetical protein
MHFVFIYKNRRMKQVEIFLRRGEERKRENDGRSKSYYFILEPHMVSPYVLDPYIMWSFKALF